MPTYSADGLRVTASLLPLSSRIGGLAKTLPAVFVLFKSCPDICLSALTLVLCPLSTHPLFYVLSCSLSCPFLSCPVLSRPPCPVFCSVLRCPVIHCLSCMSCPVLSRRLVLSPVIYLSCLLSCPVLSPVTCPMSPVPCSLSPVPCRLLPV